MKKGKATGIGGIFFKCRDPEKLKSWYENHLGLKTNEYGTLFEFRKTGQPEEKAYLQWSPMKADTTYFSPSDKDFMINYRVENLENLLEHLRESGVQIIGEVQTFEYGKFVHILDPENNKIELWEPVDAVFTAMYDGTTHTE